MNILKHVPHVPCPAWLCTLWARLRAALVIHVPCPAWLCALWARLHTVLFTDATTNTRLFFGATSLMFGVFMVGSETVHNPLSEYSLMLRFAKDWVWALLLWVNGASLIYGVLTEKYSTFLLVLEGVIGTAVWATSAYCVVYTQGTVGAQVAGALVAFWIYVRYPTHWGREDAS